MTQREKTIAIVVGAVIGLYALDQVLLSPQLDRLNAAEAKSAGHREKLDDASSVMKKNQAAARVWRPLAGDRVKTDSSSAESQLRDRVLACARAADITVPNYQFDKAEKEQGFDRLQLTVTAVGNMRQVSRFLFELQTTDAPLRVESTQLKSRTDGVDDLQLQVKLSTIYQSAGPAKVAFVGQRTENFQ